MDRRTGPQPVLSRQIVVILILSQSMNCAFVLGGDVK